MPIAKFNGKSPDSSHFLIRSERNKKVLYFIMDSLDKAIHFAYNVLGMILIPNPEAK
jgi:hypothetical protein